MPRHLVYRRYSFPVAFSAIALTSTIGACLNYLISKAFLKDVVTGLFGQASYRAVPLVHAPAASVLVVDRESACYRLILSCTNSCKDTAVDRAYDGTQRVSWLSRTIAKHQDNLLPYLIFLRISPILPSWFINAASPM